jgi:hypothetical protein
MRTVIMLLIVLPLTSCRGGLLYECKDTIYSAVKSPDGRWEASVLDRDCGATTHVTTHIQLRENRILRWFTQPKTIAYLEPGFAPETRWIGSNKLEVLMVATAKFSSRLQSWKEVQIEYRNRYE